MGCGASAVETAEGPKSRDGAPGDGKASETDAEIREQALLYGIEFYTLRQNERTVLPQLGEKVPLVVPDDGVAKQVSVTSLERPAGRSLASSLCSSRISSHSSGEFAKSVTFSFDSEAPSSLSSPASSRSRRSTGSLSDTQSRISFRRTPLRRSILNDPQHDNVSSLLALMRRTQDERRSKALEREALDLAEGKGFTSVFLGDIASDISM